MSEQIEVIRCHCGAIIAGSVMPVIPSSWQPVLDEHLPRGRTVEHVAPGEARMEECRCGEVIGKLKAHANAMCEAYDNGGQFGQHQDETFAAYRKDFPAAPKLLSQNKPNE